MMMPFTPSPRRFRGCWPRAGPHCWWSSRPCAGRPLDRLHRLAVSGGCAQVDLRGWGRLAALLTECGFDAINLVELGPFALPPIPRVAVLVRKPPLAVQAGVTTSVGPDQSRLQMVEAVMGNEVLVLEAANHDSRVDA